MRYRVLAAMSLAIVMASWVPVPSAGALASRSLTSVWFSIPTQGYGSVIQTDLSSNGASETCTDYIGRTSDGGRRFQNFTKIRTWNCTNAEDATALTFDHAGDGFFYDPNLYETHNAGATWIRVRTHGRVVAISAVGRSVWMIEAQCTAQEVSRNAKCPLKMLQSSDGGRTWSDPVALPGSSFEYPAAATETAVVQTILTRLDERRAVYSISPIVSGDVSGGRVQTWVTSDSGLRWMRRDIVCTIPTISEMLAISPSGVWTAICAGQPAAGSQAKAVMRSTDQGRTWKFVIGCSTSKSPCDGPLTAGYLGVLSAPSGSLLIESGLRSSLNVSDDGGRTWRSINGAVSDSGDGAVSLQFFNSHQGLGLTSSSNLIIRTVDGGVKWQTYRAGVG